MIESDPGFIFTVAVFLAALTVLVFVHEMGHYLVARWCKVKVDVFSIGFGKELFGWDDKHGTRWKISAIPLGGYVKFAGDATGASNPDDEALTNMTAKEKAESFHFKPLWQRAAVVFAGPFVNILFAVILFAGLFYVQGQRVIDPEVGYVAKGSPAEKAGLQVGDMIREIDGVEIDRFQDIRGIVMLLPNQTIEFDIDRRGNLLRIPVTIGQKLMSDRFGREYAIGRVGIGIIIKPIIEAVKEGSASDLAGILPNDEILAVNGIEVFTINGVVEIINERPNQETTFTILRDGISFDIRFTVPGTTIKVENNGIEEDKLVGFLELSPAVGSHTEYGLFGALSEGVKSSVSTLRTITTTMGQLIMGLRSVKEMSGPVGMATIFGEVAQRGIEDFIVLLAMISINLGFVNLLPIPMLDGGHLLFYGVEAIKGGPLPKRAQELAFMLGFMFVIGLMLFLTLNDLHSIAL